MKNTQSATASNELVLKPCPFCGGKSKFIVDRIITAKSGQSAEIGVVLCLRGCCEQHYSDIEEEAIKAWNRRTEDGS
jgi:Lar family restriction alleviation protein